MNKIIMPAVILALSPVAALAASDNWTGTTSSTWETPSNWSAGVPTTTSAVTIGTTSNNPVQLNSNVSLSGTGGSLTVGAGAAPGTPAVLNINLGDTLTMGAKPVTLAGGSITGPGTLSASTISGFGTISSQISGTGFTANATDGTVYGFPGGNFVNGTPGTALTLVGQNLASDSFTVSGHGDFNFQGVTLTTPTLNGISTNLSAGPGGGNYTYGLFSFTGANSTVVGTVNNTNYQQFNVTGTKLNLNNFALSNTWATNVPAFFVIGAGGTVDNAVGHSTLNGQMSTIMAGGSLTNTGGGTFSAAGLITGYGTVSGPLTATGGISASGGTLIVDGRSGTGVTAASAGWGATSGSVLDLKGNINFAPALGFAAAPALNPGGGTIQLDGATINTPGNAGTIQGGQGTFSVASGVNTLNGALIANGSTGKFSDVVVQNGATLNLQNANTFNTVINAQNFTLASGSVLATLGASNINNSVTLMGNYVTKQTDAINANYYEGTAGLGPDLLMNGGTASHPETLATAQTLEVGGINKGYTAAGFIDNFALHSLTIGPNAYVQLVDNYANATTSGWTGGSEALYLDGLFDGVGTATLNLNGIAAYLMGYGELQNGIYTDAQGDLVNIIGARVQAPEPATLAVLVSAMFGLGIARRQRA